MSTYVPGIKYLVTGLFHDSECFGKHKRTVPLCLVLCVLGGQISGAGDRDLPVTALVQVRRADVRA